MSVPVPFPTLELFQSQQGLWARLAAGLVCERPRREALFPWGGGGGAGLGKLLEPYLRFTHRHSVHLAPPHLSPR